MNIPLNPHQLEWLANRFKILSEPSRLQILAAICDQERQVKEICQSTGLSQANVSKHLHLMKSAGVLACRREGVCRYYRVIDADLLHLCIKARKVASQMPMDASSPVLSGSLNEN